MTSLLASAHAPVMVPQMEKHTIVVVGLSVIILKVKRVGIRLEMLHHRHVHQVNGNAKYRVFFL